LCGRSSEGPISATRTCDETAARAGSASSVTAETPPARFWLRVSGIEVKECRHVTYRSVLARRSLAVVGRSGWLEVTVRDGSAARTTGPTLGYTVIVFGASPTTVVERTIERTRISKKKH
jgi:hypothetical protein